MPCRLYHQDVADALSGLSPGDGRYTIDPIYDKQIYGLEI